MEVDDRLEGIRTPRQMLRFALPTIVVMVCISSYSIVDGGLVSNMIGTDALAGLNIIVPILGLVNAFGFMFATGGSAYIAKRLGEGDIEDARRTFSGITVIALVAALALTTVTLMFSSDLVGLLGADERLHDYAETYLRTIIVFGPIIILQYLVTQFLITAGRPDISLMGSIANGLANIVLDILFMGPLGMGIEGAAIASGIGSTITLTVGLVYFTRTKDCPLRYTRPSMSARMLGKVCSNGASEMVTELAGSVTTVLFNLTMMAYLGPDGVSSLTMMIYIQFLATAVVIGYSMGVAPIMSYNYGAGRRDLMRVLLRTSVRLVALVSIVIFLIVELFGWVIVGLFAGGSETVEEIAIHGSAIFGFSFLFMGMNIYVSSLFTSLSNGILSATVSFLRGLCLQVLMILLLPLVFGTDGIWLAVPVTEMVTIVISMALVHRMAPRYGYLDRAESVRT